MATGKQESLLLVRLEVRKESFLLSHGPFCHHHAQYKCSI